METPETPADSAAPEAKPAPARRGPKKAENAPASAPPSGRDVVVILKQPLTYCGIDYPMGARLQLPADHALAAAE